MSVVGGAAVAPRRAPDPVVQGRFTAVDGVLGNVSINVVVGDCDGDGTLDLAVLGPGEYFAPADAPPWGRAWRGDGRGGFTPGPALPFPFTGRAGALVDLDGDGVLDLVTTFGSLRVWRGDGACGFSGGAVASELPADERGNGLAVHVNDVDMDGLTDLSLAFGGPSAVPYVIFLARGDGAWERVEPAAHGDPARARSQGGVRAFTTFFDDFDDDGARDLLALADQGAAWFDWGDPGRPAAWTADPALTRSLGAVDPMAVAPLDLARDGRVAWFVSGIRGRNALLAAEGREVRDRGAEYQLAGDAPEDAWGAWAADYDFDGWTDLLLLRRGAQEQGRAAGPVDLYLRRDDGRFASMGASLVGRRFRATTMFCGDLDGHARLGCRPRRARRGCG